MQGILSLLSPIGTLFHTVFYEPMYNLLIIIYLALHSFIPAGSFAIAIVVLTLLLRSALIPLTRKQLRSSRAMQELAPRLKELQARYRNDPQGLMAAQQALYKEHGVSPVSGCLPLIVQMPFIYALYYAFFAVLKTQPGESAAAHLALINRDIYPFIPHLSQLPDMTFFWANLANPDPYHILPLLAGAFTFFQMRMALPVRAKNAPRDTTTQATGMMQYFMPLFTIFIAWGFPAGLSLYWVTSTAFSGVQQYFISGWGSMFVGIPGLEHLVPEPKSITAPAPPSRTITSTATSRALTPTEPQAPPQEGGFRGMLRQMREQMAAMQSAQPKAERPGQEETEIESTAAEESAATPPTGTQQQPRDRRQRSSKAGPVLVRPATPPPAESTETTPEIATETEPSTHGNGAKALANGTGTGGQPAANGTANGTAPVAPQRQNTANISRTSHPTPSGARTSGGGQRKGGTGSQKGSRQRSGRPKGGK